MSRVNDCKHNSKTLLLCCACAEDCPCKSGSCKESAFYRREEEKLQGFLASRVYYQTEISVSDKYPILKWFRYEHLPTHLQTVSEPFHRIANLMAGVLPNCAETSAALRKLLEAKDCAVRAALEKHAE